MMIGRLCGGKSCTQGRLGETWDTESKGGGRTQGVGNFLQGGGAGDSIVWVGDICTFGVKGEDGRGDTHIVPANNHRDVSEAVRRWDIVNARGRRRMRGIGNAFGAELHRAMAGNCGAVGGATSLI